MVRTFHIAFNGGGLRDFDILGDGFMIILTVLFVIAVFLILGILAAIGVLGAGAIIIFGDVIVALGVIGFVIYKLITKNNK
jgi:hypothetical protein